jgi:midasin
MSLKKRSAFVHQITQSKEIEQLQDDLSCVFEWTDGILVEAMQKGGLLLIDEISLANDSVLERLNSVFEHDRTLVVSEKSSQEAVRIVADTKFNMVATMNPGSDFGKKELSPALRNRLTEIWVESYFTQPELISLYADQVPLKTMVPSSVDLNLIVTELCLDQLGTGSEAIANGIFNMIGFVNFTMT